MFTNINIHMLTAAVVTQHKPPPPMLKNTRTVNFHLYSELEPSSQLMDK